jgi:hypothetical protein
LSPAGKPVADQEAIKAVLDESLAVMVGEVAGAPDVEV